MVRFRKFKQLSVVLSSVQKAMKEAKNLDLFSPTKEGWDCLFGPVTIARNAKNGAFCDGKVLQSRVNSKSSFLKQPPTDKRRQLAKSNYVIVIAHVFQSDRHPKATHTTGLYNKKSSQVDPAPIRPIG